MEVIFVDSEPPGLAGGGIRTYLRLTLRACRESGITTRVYTHNPHAYPGETAVSIGRLPFLSRPWRGMAYRLQYSENVLWEHAFWLAQEVAAKDSPGMIYEFPDFQGYGFFLLRNPALRNRVIVRVHTPNYMVTGKSRRLTAILASWQGAWRERDSLRRARQITVPSAEFVKEKLPSLKNWIHLPNPLPLDTGEFLRNQELQPTRLLYLGRVEPRKGVLTLVHAFLNLAAKRPELSLTLVGSSVPGPYANAVRRLIDAQAPEIRCRLTWEPPCPPEMRPALFARFQALVVPSIWENSPYVYFEGMAAGLLCIGSATGEMKAVAHITGGPSVRPGDMDEWVLALQAATTQSSQDILLAQYAYLRTRRQNTLKRLVAYYAEVAVS